MNDKRKAINLKLWALGLSSALLLSVPYMVPHTGMIMFVAFLPLLAAEYLASGYGKKNFWIIYYCTFLIWNIITTYWIYLATLPGAIAAVTINALQMAIIFRLFRWFKKLSKGILPYIFFMVLWIGWEHLYFTWQISWPWLVLGNAFATSLKSVQWYSLTGTLGGSLWILLINILLFRLLVLYSQGKKIKISAAAVAIIVIVPVTYSLIRYYTYKEESGENITKEVAVLQPNIDPFYDKFSGMTRYEQNKDLFELAEQSVTKNTFLMLAPETFYTPSSRFEELLEYTPDDCHTYAKFKDFCRDKKVYFIFGAVTKKSYMPAAIKDPKALGGYVYDLKKAPTPTARPIGGGIVWYDVFNSAVFTGPQNECDFYHKSKLVILAESTPIIHGKKVFDSFGIDLGGAVGSFGKQEEPSVFSTKTYETFGTAICYDSVYGDYFRGYVNKGAEFMTIITNDGWWGNTAGHLQHLHYASLRAIETRRDIARCGNTGISAFINQRGDIVSQTKWWTRCWLRGNVNLNDKITPFVKYGDVTGRVCVFAFLLMILLGIVRQITGKTIIRGMI